MKVICRKVKLNSYFKVCEVDRLRAVGGGSHGVGCGWSSVWVADVPVLNQLPEAVKRCNILF
jgi:hypothetical protein